MAVSLHVGGESGLFFQLQYLQCLQAGMVGGIDQRVGTEQPLRVAIRYKLKQPERVVPRQLHASALSRIQQQIDLAGLIRRELLGPRLAWKRA